MKTKLFKMFLAALGLAVSVAASAAPTAYVFKRIAPGVACAGTGCDLQSEIAASAAPAANFNVTLARAQFRALAQGAVLWGYTSSAVGTGLNEWGSVGIHSDIPPSMDGAIFAGGTAGVQKTDLNLLVTIPVRGPSTTTIPAGSLIVSACEPSPSSLEVIGTFTWGATCPGDLPAITDLIQEFTSQVVVYGLTPEACAAIGTSTGVSCSGTTAVATAAGTFTLKYSTPTNPWTLTGPSWFDTVVNFSFPWPI